LPSGVAAEDDHQTGEPIALKHGLAAFDVVDGEPRVDSANREATAMATAELDARAGQPMSGKLANTVSGSTGMGANGLKDGGPPVTQLSTVSGVVFGVAFGRRVRRCFGVEPPVARR
jgi:hypothetical protein